VQIGNTLHNTVINNVQIGIEVTSNQTLEMAILFAPCHYISQQCFTDAHT